MKRTIASFIATAALLGVQSISSGAAIQIDFGATTVVSTTSSPAHADGKLGASDTTWVKMGTSDIASGVLYTDGSTATGVSLDLGANTSVTESVTTINFATNPNTSSTLSNTSGGQTGIYATNSVGTDIITGPAAFNNNNQSLGLKVNGLAAGQYYVYVTGFDYRSVGAQVGAGKNTYDVYASTGADATTYDFTSVANKTTYNNLTRASWIAGDNYGRLTVTLAEGQSLFLASDATGTNSTRAFLSAVQVVAVPEPATAGLLAIGGVAMLARRRRHA